MKFRWASVGRSSEIDPAAEYSPAVSIAAKILLMLWSSIQLNGDDVVRTPSVMRLCAAFLTPDSRDIL